MCVHQPAPVTVQTMQAGHKHKDLGAAGGALQHVAVQRGVDYQRGVQTGCLGKSREEEQRSKLEGYTEMEIS